MCTARASGGGGVTKPLHARAALLAHRQMSMRQFHGTKAPLHVHSAVQCSGGAKNSKLSFSSRPFISSSRHYELGQRKNVHFIPPHHTALFFYLSLSSLLYNRIHGIHTTNAKQTCASIYFIAAQLAKSRCVCEYLKSYLFVFFFFRDLGTISCLPIN